MARSRGIWGIVLAVLVLCAPAMAGPMAPLARDRANNGQFGSYSNWENDKYTLWNLYITPSITEPLWHRTFQFAEPGYGNSLRPLEQPLGQILGAGSHRNEGLFIIYDMLVQEVVTHLLYLDPRDMILVEEPVFEPQPIDRFVLGQLRLESNDQRVFLDPPPPIIIPEPSTAGSLLLGLMATTCLIFRRPATRHRVV